MRKLVIVLLLITLLLQSSCGNNTAESHSNMPNGENGNGESETHGSTSSEIPKTDYTRIETSYGASGEVYYWKEFKYGSDGKLESITSYRADESESGHVDIMYDEHGTQLSEIAFKGLGESNSSDGLPLPVIDETTGSVFLINQYEYEYDVNGNITVKRSDQITEEYEYDDTGKCIKSYRSYQYGFMAISYEYDNNGNLISETDYDEDDNLISRILYQYDTEGREVVQENYSCLNSETTLRYRYEFAYTADGKLSKVSSYWYDTYSELINTRYTIYYYDEQGTFIASEEYHAVDGQEVLFERVECAYQ